MVPFDDKLWLIMALFDILDVAFMVLKDSSNVDWHSPESDLLVRQVAQFGKTVARGMLSGRVASFRVVVASVQYCHVLLSQFSIQRSRGEPLIKQSLYALTRVVWILGLGSLEDRE